MGYSCEFYVGAYLEVMADPIVEIIHKVGCPKCQRAMGNKGQFCPECGTKLAVIEFKEEQEASIYTLLPDPKDVDILIEAYRPGLEAEGIILMGNYSDVGDSLGTDPGCTVAEITPKVIADCLAAFNRKYGKVIKKLRHSPATKVKSIQLKFGAFSHYV